MNRIEYLTLLLDKIRAGILSLSEETALSVNLAGTSYTLADIGKLYELETKITGDLEAEWTQMRRPRFTTARIGGADL